MASLHPSPVFRVGDDDRTPVGDEALDPLRWTGVGPVNVAEEVAAAEEREDLRMP